MFVSDLCVWDRIMYRLECTVPGSFAHAALSISGINSSSPCSAISDFLCEVEAGLHVHPNSGVVRKYLARRRAVSVVIGVCSAAIRSMRVRGRLSFFASAPAPSSEGLDTPRGGFAWMDRRKDMSHLKLPVCPRLAFNGSQLFQRLRYRHLSMKHRSICATGH